MELTIPKRNMRSILASNMIPAKVTASINLNDLHSTVKKKVHKALDEGVIFAMTGINAEMYEFIGTAYQIPIMRVRRERARRYHGMTEPPNRWVIWSVNSPLGDNKPLVELLLAEKTAQRMNGEKDSYYWDKMPDKYENGYNVFTQIKDKKTLIEAARARCNTPEVRARILAAQKALADGEIITVREVAA